MKKLFFVLAVLCIANSANAQWFFNKERLANLENFDKKRFSWGYFLGFNSYDFKIDIKTNMQMTIQIFRWSVLPALM